MTPQTKTDIERITDTFLRQVKADLIRYANHLPYVQHEKPIPAEQFKIILPVTNKQRFLLLNWRVWCMRYHITPFFIMEALFKRFSNQRSRNISTDPYTISLGVPLAILTGVTARQYLEEEVLRRYPNGENVKMAKQRQIIPLVALDYNDNNMAQVYRRAIAERREALEQQEKQIRRPYRGR